MAEKKRLDILVYEKGFAESREKAKAIIMAGLVYVDNQKADKPGTVYPEDCNLEYRGEKQKYVSRGGYKLEKAIKKYELNEKFASEVIIKKNYYNSSNNCDLCFVIYLPGLCP